MGFIQKSLQLAEDGQYESALQLLNENLPNAKRKEQFEGGILLFQWGHLDAAEKIFTNLHQQEPQQNMITSVLMQIYFMQEREDDAFRLLGVTEREQPGYEDILLTLADYYFGMGLYEVSEQKLLEAYDLQPDSVAVLFALKEYYEQMDDMGMYFHFLKKLKERDPDFSDDMYQLQLAMAYMSLGKYEEALCCFEQVSDEQIVNEKDRFYYGLCLFFHERYEAAIPIFQAAMKSNETLKKGVSYLAHAYIQLRRFREAEEVLESHIQKFPSDEGILQMLANLYLDEKKYDKAKPVVEALLKLDDENFVALIQYAWILVGEEAYEALISFVEEKLEAGIEISELYWLLAKSYAKIEAYEQALKQYAAAYNGLHDEIAFLLDYAQFLMEEGQRKAAAQIYREILDIDITNEEAHEYLERLTEDG